MGILLTLFGLLFAGAICLALFVLAATVVKFAVHVVLLPLKLILLPFILVAVILKVAILVTLVTVGLALLIPIAVVVGLLAAPFAIIGALA